MAENTHSTPVEVLEPEDLSPRPHRPKGGAVAEGIALVKQGATFRQAAAATGLHHSTIHEAWQNLLGPDAPDRDEKRRLADEYLLASSYGIAAAGMARMAREIEDVDQRTLTGWVGLASNNVARIRGWDRGIGDPTTGEQVADVLERLAEGGGVRVSLEVERIDRVHSKSSTEGSGEPEER